MRKVFAAVSAAAFMVVLALPAFAAETVKGKLIDQGCYLKDKASGAGNDHGDMKDCATMCAKKGQPVALLTDDGKVLTVTGELAKDNNAKLVAHMGHTVELTGDVTTADGKSAIAATNLKMISR
jgi:hypothetical protein